MHIRTTAATVVIILSFVASAAAQHLWWDLEGQRDATCLYGEITVLATRPNIYYCGANWHPGEPAGGYCGIQHNSDQERRTIFSIWDTAPKLHPQVTQADPKTIFNRFGGEGTGAHTHMPWDWKVGDVFQFFVQKQPGKKDTDTTDTRYYVFDRDRKQWLHSATISSPNGSNSNGGNPKGEAKGAKQSVATIGGGLNSFLENFSGQDRAAPKLATYRLWLGSSVGSLKCLTRASGDGDWGQIHDAYFLAEGERGQLDAVFAKLAGDYGQPVFGEKGAKLDPISNKPAPAAVLEALKSLPATAPVKEKNSLEPDQE